MRRDILSAVLGLGAEILIEKGFSIVCEEQDDGLFKYTGNESTLENYTFLGLRSIRGEAVPTEEFLEYIVENYWRKYGSKKKPQKNLLRMTIISY